MSIVLNLANCNALPTIKEKNMIYFFGGPWTIKIRATSDTRAMACRPMFSIVLWATYCGLQRIGRFAFLSALLLLGYSRLKIKLFSSKSQEQRFSTQGRRLGLQKRNYCFIEKTCCSEKMESKNSGFGEKNCCCAVYICTNTKVYACVSWRWISCWICSGYISTLLIFKKRTWPENV